MVVSSNLMLADGFRKAAVDHLQSSSLGGRKDARQALASTKLESSAWPRSESLQRSGDSSGGRGRPLSDSWEFALVRRKGFSGGTGALFSPRCIFTGTLNPTYSMALIMAATPLVDFAVTFVLVYPMFHRGSDSGQKSRTAMIVMFCTYFLVQPSVNAFYVTLATDCE